MSKPSISPASLSWRLKDVISSNWFVRGEEEERKRRRTLTGIWGVWGSEGTGDARSDTVLNACECNTGALLVQS